MRNFRLLILSMGPDTDSLKNEPKDLILGWSQRLSLTSRILAVNLFVLALLAGGLFFLDSYRSRLIEESVANAQSDAALLATALTTTPAKDRAQLVIAIAKLKESRIRVYNAQGDKTLDSFTLAPPAYKLRDPKTEPWDKKTAAMLDRSFDFLVGAPKLRIFKEPVKDSAKSWDSLRKLEPGAPNSDISLAPDFTHMLLASASFGQQSFGQQGERLLITQNKRNIRISVRAERFRVGIFFLIVVAIGTLLSLFLARTIVRPIRRLAIAAVKVRTGRAQEVTVPRLPSRRDEIGMLARALSDMSITLRQRIDATEAFAADVAHEIKNPLASMRSALEGLETVRDAKLRKQLMDVAKADVQRMDRLISDISEASRVDAQLAKAKFEPIDVGDMIEQLVLARESSKRDGSVKLAYARPRRGSAVILGEDMRMERVLNNLIDNAVSFSRDGGLVEIAATNADDEVILRVTDEGPGVPENEREAIFRRFHSERPSNEAFGNHSGLGLAIARTIIEGHKGSIRVTDREDGRHGASFEITLPAYRPGYV